MGKDCRSRANDKIKTKNIGKNIKKAASGVYYVIIPAFTSSN